MIRSANHSSFPKVGESPLDQQLRTARQKQERGALDAASVAQITDEVTTICVAEQSRAFIDIVTDGMVGWEGPYSRLARHLEGLQTGGLFRWFDTNFYDHRLQVTGEIRRDSAFVVHDYQVAETVAQDKTVKPVLPGPVTCARMAHDRHYGGVEPLAAAFAEVFAAEFAALAAAGARCFQLDEPLLCRHPEDLDLVAETAARVFEGAGRGATTILSTYFGNLEPLAGRLDRLPGTHLGMEALEGSANLGLLEALPADKGVYLGLFDARTTRQEDAAEVAERLEPHRDLLTRRDVIVGPNAGLELLPRDPAFDKLLHARYLVEKLTPGLGMSLRTTTVGSFPKPRELRRARWAFAEELIGAAELRQAEDRAVREWIELQQQLGLELLTDGEMRRGDMVGFLAGRLEGLEDAGLVRCFGNRYYRRPRVGGPIERRDSLTVEDWKAAQALTAGTVKAVLPGPYTLMDWSFDEHYDSRQACCLAFAEAIRVEAEDLVRAGATEIQLDEPAISARPGEMELAAAALGQVTAGLRGKARVWAHVAYGDHAPVIEQIFALPVDGLLLEMANSDYLLLDALKQFPADKLLAAGVVDAVGPRIESADEIRARMARLLEQVPADRLWLAPDAGLRSLTTAQARAKLEALAEAAAS